MSRNEERMNYRREGRYRERQWLWVMAGSGDCELELLRRNFFDKGKFLADGRVSPLAAIGSPFARPYLAGDSPSNYWRGKRLITTYESSTAPVSSYTTLTDLA